MYEAKIYNVKYETKIYTVKSEQVFKCSGKTDSIQEESTISLSYYFELDKLHQRQFVLFVI